ncbi:MAG: lysylphosphatidylglycerol synthase domain-containing protein, partial [Candidatus Aminicenantales bacterium]
AWIEKREIHLEALDQNLRLLYSRSNRKAILPFILHVTGRLLGTVEVMIIMAVLKAPVNFIQAIFICTVVTVGNSIFFILPGQWGVMESVHILVLQSLGYPAAIGLSLSVIRRIRSLLFVGLGLILFASGKRKSPPKKGS